MNAPHFSLIVPTLNEAHNIPAFLRGVNSSLEGIDYEIIFVDDNSNDGTQQIVQAHARTDSRVSLIVRTNQRGLSSAVLRGMEGSQGEILGVMDADLSHDEKLLPTLLRAVESGAEIAIGSRRLPGGGADRWPAYRRLASTLATQLTIRWLNIPLSDPMSGFFLIQRKVYDRTKNQLEPKGYKILLELYCAARPAQVAEFPYVFKDRSQGHSKLSFRVMLEFLSSLWHLRALRHSPSAEHS